MRAYLCVRVRETINTVVSAYLMLLATISNTGTASSSSSNRLMRPLRTYMRYHCIDCMAAVASPASGHVGTCPHPLGVWEIFFSLYVETSCLVWFGTMPNSNSALFFQPYSLWSDTITGYNGACAKANVVLPRDAMRYSAVFAVVRCPSVRLSIMFVHCIQTAEDIVKHLSRPGSPMILVFCPQAPILNSKGTPSAGAQNTRGWGKFAIFDWNRCLSLKRYSCHGTLIGSHRWRIDTCRFRWPWVTPNRGFKITVYLQVEYLKNGAT